MKITLGQDFYKALKKNNTGVWAMCIVTLLVSLYSIYSNRQVALAFQKHIYAVDDKGEIIPLRLLDQKETKLIEVKANLDRFVNLYYQLDGYTVKNKQEKLMWLLGTQPTEKVKDRVNKGYFNDFLSITGLQQKAFILGQTLKVKDEGDGKYTASFVVRIQRINADKSIFFNSEIECTMMNVEQNYPYNPFGLLIIQLSENLVRIENPNDDIYRKEVEASDKSYNQNVTIEKEKENEDTNTEL